MTTYLHDPQDVLDYKTNVEGLAVGELVASVTATGPAGITIAPSGHTTDHDDTSVWFWATGGTIGEVYDVVLHVTTNQGRQADKTIRLRCVQR